MGSGIRSGGLSPLGQKGNHLHGSTSLRSGVHGRPTGRSGGDRVSNKWDFLKLPIQPNDNFDVFWRWNDERNGMFERRLTGEALVAAPPGDKFLSTLATYSFCNPFRVLDTGSQIVVHLQQLSPEPVEGFFRP